MSKIGYYLAKLREFLLQCKRVLTVASKPDKEEFSTSLKIVLIGMTILGLVAFLIFVIFQLLSGVL